MPEGDRDRSSISPHAVDDEGDVVCALLCRQGWIDVPPLLPSRYVSLRGPCRATKAHIMIVYASLEAHVMFFLAMSRREDVLCRLV